METAGIPIMFMKKDGTFPERWRASRSSCVTSSYA
jgi:hypothetical protein